MKRKTIGSVPKWLLLALIVLSVIGFADATYLTVSHYSNTSVVCFNIPGTQTNCDKVTSSQYAMVAGIPVALMGSAYYLMVLVLSSFYFWMYRKAESEKGKEKELVIDFLSRFTILGFLASVWFVYLQLFVIRDICSYCMLSALTSTLIFALGITVMIIKKRSPALDVSV